MEVHKLITSRSSGWINRMAVETAGFESTSISIDLIISKEKLTLICPPHQNQILHKKSYSPRSNV